MRKYFAGTLVAICLSPCLLVEPALAAKYPLNFSVTCTSTGQICDKFATIPAPLPPGWFNLATPDDHCSKVKYTVTFLGIVRQPGSPPPILSTYTTRFLAAREYEQINVDKRANNARISATGQIGGCNTGTLRSWGVRVVSPQFTP